MIFNVYRTLFSLIIANFLWRVNHFSLSICENFFQKICELCCNFRIPLLLHSVCVRDMIALGKFFNNLLSKGCFL